MLHGAAGDSRDTRDTCKRKEQGAAVMRQTERLSLPGKDKRKAKIAGGGKINTRPRSQEEGRSQRCTPLVRGAPSTAGPRVLGEGRRAGAGVAVPGVSACRVGRGGRQKGKHTRQGEWDRQAGQRTRQAQTAHLAMSC